MRGANSWRCKSQPRQQFVPLTVVVANRRVSRVCCCSTTVEGRVPQDQRQPAAGDHRAAKDKRREPSTNPFENSDGSRARNGTCVDSLHIFYVVSLQFSWVPPIQYLVFCPFSCSNAFHPLS